MGVNLYTCLWANGKADEMIEYYSHVFPNVTLLSNTSIVSNIEINGFKLMLLNAVSQFEINPSISFLYNCSSENEVVEIWEKLKPNSKVLMDLGKYPWAEQYGWIQDAFGVNWQLIYIADNKNWGKILPSLMFTGINNGKLADAILFYQTIFGTDNAHNIVAKYGENDPDTTGNIKYAEFDLIYYPMVAMENSGSHDFQFNEGVSLVVECNTQTEIDHFWFGLSDGGSLGQCGWLKDRYGISWQIVPKILGEIMEDKDLALTATDIVLHSTKFEISKFEAIRKLKEL
ncbi:VOC family protein [Rhizosphaericola mali]|uniref:VOC family protein n=1 Tax=Rhizosphaericola mali TaxID=2545455 RepID=A0A5P2G960_9BACT|nr:VOC family protein [Rhizosphaericola mali]QES90849.1 VOC family protein [Rhizosphaericola mali]